MSKRGSFRGYGGGRGRGGGSGSNTRFTGKKRANGGGVAYGIDRPAPVREDDGSQAMEKFEEVRLWDEVDSKLGFQRFESARHDGESRTGWLVNMHQVGTSSPAKEVTNHRLCYTRRHIPTDWQLSTTTLSKTMEGCSKRLCRTSLISTLLVGWVAFMRGFIRSVHN